LEKDYPIVITYRRTRRLSIRIGVHGDVRVSAPLGYPRDKIEAFIDDNAEWIERSIRRTETRQEKRNEFFEQQPLSTRAEREEALRRLEAIIPPLVERHAKRMGVSPSGIFYSATTSKWGSCFSRTRRLQFSAYLLLLPDWCVEHVVVHELAHLIEANHGPKFYLLMDKYFPRWREARQETRRLSRMEIGE